MKNERSSHMAGRGGDAGDEGGGDSSGDVGAVICATFTPDELVPLWPAVEELGIMPSL